MPVFHQDRPWRSVAVGLGSSLTVLASAGVGLKKPRLAEPRFQQCFSRKSQRFRGSAQKISASRSVFAFGELAFRQEQLSLMLVGHTDYHGGCSRVLSSSWMTPILDLTGRSREHSSSLLGVAPCTKLVMCGRINCQIDIQAGRSMSPHLACVLHLQRGPGKQALLKQCGESRWDGSLLRLKRVTGNLRCVCELNQNAGVAFCARLPPLFSL